MTIISVDCSKAKKETDQMLKIAKEAKSMSDRIKTIRNEIDVSSPSMRSVKQTILKIESNVLDEAVKMDSMATVLEQIVKNYQITENIIVNSKVAIDDGHNKFVDSNTKEEVFDIIKIIKTILKTADSWGDDEEAGILEGVLSYFEDLVKFCTGDMKGETGARDWCQLASSSVSLWVGLYNYYGNVYDELKKIEDGFFGEKAQYNVGIIAVVGSVLGLGASLIDASIGLDEKEWQSIVADYIGCGEDGLSIIKAGYSLGHIGDVESLSSIKAGIFSALDIYTAIGKSAIGAVSQGFRSHEKYYADGSWDAGDTGATGIDISMAGLYGLSHSLTLGTDDFIFGVIDNISGGSDNGMSPYEKAAEGWKILATKTGEAIVNLFRK